MGHFLMVTQPVGYGGASHSHQGCWTSESNFLQASLPCEFGKVENETSDQPRTPYLLEGKSRILTRFVVRGASLTVVSVGATLAHAQALGPRQRGAAIIRARSAPARVKLGRVFSKSFLEVAPSCHRAGDVSHQVRDGSELGAEGRELRPPPHSRICCPHCSILRD